MEGQLGPRGERRPRLRPAGHQRGLFMATSGDPQLAASEDFFMATASTSSSARTRETAEARSTSTDATRLTRDP